MTTPEEQKSYAKGYQAGLRRAVREQRIEIRQQREQAFWDRAVLSVAPFFMAAQNWTQGKRNLTSLVDRAQLCVDFANTVTKARGNRP